MNWSETWPGDNVEPEIGHEAWIAYDDEALYVAWIVTEDPSNVRAPLRDRDEIWRDDYVGLIFDTYGSGAWAYELVRCHDEKGGEVKAEHAGDFASPIGSELVERGVDLSPRSRPSTARLGRSACAVLEPKNNTALPPGLMLLPRRSPTMSPAATSGQMPA